MLELLSFLVNLGQIVAVVVLVAVLFFIGRAVLRRAGGGGEWEPYTRPVIDRTGEAIEIGVKRSRYLGITAPQRITIETISARLVSDDPRNLYTLQSKAQETAASFNARRDQSDY